MSSLPKLCLNMIVKNESHIIEEKLNKLLNKISFDYYVICDTGSDDNTKEIIKSFFDKRGLKGEIFDHKWSDFGTNRTKALQEAYGKSEYIFIFDADDEIQGEINIPIDLCFDKYNLKIGNSFTYYRPLLLNNQKKWHFVGVLHEYLSTDEKNITETILDGNYYVVSCRDGNRNRDRNKYIKDATILQDAYEKIKDSDERLANRYAFYCAQSYKDAGKNYTTQAIKWYSKILKLTSWTQEKYYSCLMLGELYEDDFKKLEYYMKSIEYDNERIEGMVFACKLASKKGIHSLVNMLYHTYKNIKKPTNNKLFVFSNLYNDHLAFYASISNYYLHNPIAGYNITRMIIKNNILDNHMLDQIYRNLLFYKTYIEKEFSLELFQQTNSLLHSKHLRNEDIDNSLIELWNYLYSLNRIQFTKPYNYSFTNNNKPKLVLTFTTCKRFDLFQQTVRSFVHHLEDISSIDYWFCVDDNSSIDDREKMKTEFHWIDYYMKDINEKGHRQSMNIIYNKLIQLNPTYWLHLEDDFLFINNINIQDMIQKLDIFNVVNAKQILFNINYAETIEDYSIKGNLSTNVNNITVHNHKKGDFPYKNCHYWPHYSFRPSIIKFDAIKEIGNFNTENQFFEMDYANKYTNKGFTSIFLNEIKHIHIGRLTSERNTTCRNAYELNNEEQFYNVKLPIKIINLKRRPDRLQNVKNLFQNNKISNLEIFEAIDGNELKINKEIAELFIGNDFYDRKGVIGCALSHYTLWKNLLNDESTNYYLIFEDDLTFGVNFNHRLQQLKNEMNTNECLFLGYHMFEKNRNQYKRLYENNNQQINIDSLNTDLYIGGFFSYSINKQGARKLVDYIEKNGIKHGIDYLILILKELQCYECQPQLVFSEWNEGGKQIDSNIQNLGERFHLNEFLLNYNKEKNTRKRVKLLCNWCCSKELCTEWKYLFTNDFIWNNMEITWENENIDYYVIINSPYNNEYYDKKKTIIFQMEPWVYDLTKNWGVKTWGQWSKPNPKEFLEVFDKDRDTYNNIIWQIHFNDEQLKNIQYDKQDRLSIITTSKYFDEGHIARIDFLHFLEKKGDIPMHIFGKVQELHFKNYQHTFSMKDKHQGILPYKYYFMVENNYERNYITEKLWEPILCECLTFYYGCPNVSDYIDPNAYVQLDMNDFEKSYQIIKQAIKEDWWSQRIESIKKCKNKILNEMAFLPRLQSIISNKNNN